MFMQYNLQLGTANANAFVRVALVWFQQPAGLQLAPDQLWTDGGTAAATLGARELRHVLKFKVLWFRQHRLSFDNANAQAKMFIRLRRKTRYTGAAGTAAQLQSGALYLVIISDIDVAVPADQPDFLFHSRLRFVG